MTFARKRYLLEGNFSGKIIFAGKQKITENHHCGTMVFDRQKIFQKKKIIMPETEGDFALSLEYFSLKTTFCKWQFFTQHISWSSGLSVCFFPKYLPPQTYVLAKSAAGERFAPQTIEVWSWRITPRKIKRVDQPDWEWIRSLVPRGSTFGVAVFLHQFFGDSWPMATDSKSSSDEDGQGK